MSTHRTLRHSNLYDEQLKEFGDAKLVEESIEAAIWAISTKPDFFEPIPKTELRFVRTIQYERKGSLMIPLKIWFKIMDENQVLLLSITQDSLIGEFEGLDENDFPF